MEVLHHISFRLSTIVDLAKRIGGHDEVTVDQALSFYWNELRDEGWRIQAFTMLKAEPTLVRVLEPTGQVALVDEQLWNVVVLGGENENVPGLKRFEGDKQ